MRIAKDSWRRESETWNWRPLPETLSVMAGLTSKNDVGEINDGEQMTDYQTLSSARRVSHGAMRLAVTYAIHSIEDEPCIANHVSLHTLNNTWICSR